MAYDKKASVGSEAVDGSAEGHAEMTRFRKSHRAHARPPFARSPFECIALLLQGGRASVLIREAFTARCRTRISRPIG